MRIVHQNKFAQVLTKNIDRTNEIRITADQHKRISLILKGVYQHGRRNVDI